MNETHETVIIGGAQSGLSMGYHLKRRDLPFVILDANERIGDSWRKRWDSMRLFTPRNYDGLAGMPFPARRVLRAPTKDEFADYLESYAEQFDLRIRTGVKVQRVSREDDRFVVETTAGRLEADQVVVATGAFQTPKVPAFARELDPGIVQLHSVDYRNPSQLRQGGVLVVGVGNSGADIAIEVSKTHQTWLSGRDKGQVPVRIESPLARFVLPILWFIASHVLTVKTPIGRRAQPHVLANGAPRIRVKTDDLEAAGVDRVPKTVAVSDGLPVLEDGRALDVANVIWCTGFRQNFSWIDVPVFGEQEELRHERGVTSEPGLYFVGLDFLYSFTSENVGGVYRDAEHIARHIARHRA